jgi:hypothetical protein
MSITALTGGLMGRARKSGARQPAGKLRPDAERLTMTGLHRLRALANNPFLETQVGRLGYLGELSLGEVSTAFRIAEIWGRYDRAIDTRRTPASPSYEMGRTRDTTGEESDEEREANEKAIRDFGALLAELTVAERTLGRGTKAAVEALCVDDSYNPMWFQRVKLALGLVEQSFSVGKRRKGHRGSW